MFQNFSEEAIRVVMLAIEEVYQAGDSYIGTEHILVGLTKSPSVTMQTILQEYKLSAERLIPEIAVLKKQEGRERKRANLLLATENKPAYSPRCNRIFKYCQDAKLVTEKDLLLSILREAKEVDQDGYAYQILIKLKIDIDGIANQ